MSPLKNLSSLSTNKIFIYILAASIILGIASGTILAKTKSSNLAMPLVNNAPKSAQQDSKTFRDFAEGTIQKRPPSQNGEYLEGTHLLIREGATAVALTSSVVDLSLYEGKKVKVLGETQKAIKEGWLMDVGKVEVK